MKDAPPSPVLEVFQTRTLWNLPSPCPTPILEICPFHHLNPSFLPTPQCPIAPGRLHSLLPEQPSPVASYPLIHPPPPWQPESPFKTKSLLWLPTAFFPKSLAWHTRPSVTALLVSPSSLISGHTTSTSNLACQDAPHQKLCCTPTMCRASGQGLGKKQALLEHGTHLQGAHSPAEGEENKPNTKGLVSGSKDE